MAEELKYKCESDDFQVEYDIVPLSDKSVPEIKHEISKGISEAEAELVVLEKKLDSLNKEIDRLTNHADGPDYICAVLSGIAAGVIDILFVDDFTLANANKWGTDKVNKFVMKVAKSKGYKGSELKGAVSFLEKKFPIAADTVAGKLGGGPHHHIRDFSHHPNIIGLIFSMLTQFTKMVYGTNEAGMFIAVPVEEASGINLIGDTFPEKIMFGLVNWFFHIVSDMAGSSGAIRKKTSGTGLPGFLLSKLKEISALPFFKKLNENGYKKLSAWIQQLFDGKLINIKDEQGKLIRFDLRTEIGFAGLLAKQTIPVIVNEVIVRGFYFVRRLAAEIREKKIKSLSELDKLDPQKFIPFRNRTISRMLTISTSIMTVIDLTDAAIEGAIKSGGVNNPLFVRNMIVKVNFVGIGRCAIAIGTDSVMGIERVVKINQAISVKNQMIFYKEAKLYYCMAGVWINASEADKAIADATEMMKKSIQTFSESMGEIKDDMESIREKIGILDTEQKRKLGNILR